MVFENNILKARFTYKMAVKFFKNRQIKKEREEAKVDNKFVPVELTSTVFKISAIFRQNYTVHWMKQRFKKNLDFKRK
jgi:hypothetical protein